MPFSSLLGEISKAHNSEEKALCEGSGVGAFTSHEAPAGCWASFILGAVNSLCKCALDIVCIMHFHLFFFFYVKMYRL